MSTWIHDRRKMAGLSQSDVAQSLGMSRPTYMKLEKGVHTPTEEQKALLSRIFKMSHDAVGDVSAQQEYLASDRVEIRNIPKENEQKFQEILLYILGKVGSRPNIGQTALYKLLYFIDFDYYEKFEEQLIGATYIKNTYGPTPVSFAKIVKKNGSTREDCCSEKQIFWS